MVRGEIRDTLDVLANFKEEQMPFDEIRFMLKHWVKRTASRKGITEETAHQLLADNFEAHRRIWQAAFTELEMEAAKEMESAVPAHLKEYRYAVAGIVKIYKEVLKKSIHRKTVNDHMTADSFGISKLKRITVENERNSVLESDLLEYFYRVANVKLKPEDIRRFSYRSPIKTVI